MPPFWINPKSSIIITVLFMISPPLQLYFSVPPLIHLPTPNPSAPSYIQISDFLKHLLMSGV